MGSKNLTCIGCPMGCQLNIEMNGTEIVSVSGQTCKRGEIYARKELTNPTRIVTTTVCVEGGETNTVSVKTEQDIPKDKIHACIQALKDVTIHAPIFIGDVVLENIVDTGVNIVATKNVK